MNTLPNEEAHSMKLIGYGFSTVLEILKTYFYYSLYHSISKNLIKKRKKFSDVTFLEFL